MMNATGTQRCKKKDTLAQKGAGRKKHNKIQIMKEEKNREKVI